MVPQSKVNWADFKEKGQKKEGRKEPLNFRRIFFLSFTAFRIIEKHHFSLPFLNFFITHYFAYS